jgi:hypothetical protein
MINNDQSDFVMKKGMLLALPSFALYLIVKFNYNLITISHNVYFLEVSSSCVC